jgi:hypothetical protein
LSGENFGVHIGEAGKQGNEVEIIATLDPLSAVVVACDTPLTPAVALEQLVELGNFFQLVFFINCKQLINLKNERDI